MLPLELATLEDIAAELRKRPVAFVLLAMENLVATHPETGDPVLAYLADNRCEAWRLALAAAKLIRAGAE